MSNLSQAVTFDILRGWPNGPAIDESYPPADGVTLHEGELVQLQSDGTVDHASAIAVEGSAAPIKLKLVIQGNDQFDAAFVGKVVTLSGRVTIQTEKYVGTGFTPGDLVTVSIETGTEGYIIARADLGGGGNNYTTGQVFGEVESFDSAATKLVVALWL